MPAPVVIFVYNRLDNTRQTIEHLFLCPEVRDTDIYVFSDGGKDAKSWKQVDALRDYLHTVRDEALSSRRCRSFTIVERRENFYLERNITEGIAEVFETHDRIIVLEDDICVSEHFLRYMNTAFDLYNDEPRVMHISGFTNLDLPGEHKERLLSNSAPEPDDTYFTPHMSGWGWGTWRDRWQQFVHFQSEAEGLAGLSAADCDTMQYGGVFPCLRSLKKKPIPWDICWEIAIYKAHAFCLTPCHTLVRNVGLDSGTHFRSYSLLQSYSFDREPLHRPLAMTRREPKANPVVEDIFRDAIRDWGIVYTPLGKVLRKIKRMVVKRR